MGWSDFLRFVRIPLFEVSLLIFVAGLVYRVARVVTLGWTRDRIPRAGSRVAGVVRSYAKGAIAWPFIPRLKHTFRGNAVTYLAGGLFHLGLFAVILLSSSHERVWKSHLGFGWPTLPVTIVDLLSAGAILAMIALLINRFAHPVVRKLTGPREVLTWLFVFLPMLTGFMTTHRFLFSYQVLLSFHILTVDVMLMWIPFSPIPHFVFYFFSRTIHGVESGKRAVSP